MADTLDARPAASWKYDILAALAVAALAQGSTERTTTLRLIAVVAARYDWRRDSVSIGTADLARLWSVDERTAKRELKRLRDTGILVLKRAGVRGRVAAYGLDHAQLKRIARLEWPRIGHDFVERYQERLLPKESRNDPGETSAPHDMTGSGAWQRLAKAIKTENDQLYRAWFSQVICSDADDLGVRLSAPTRFVGDYIRMHYTGYLEALALSTLGKRLLFSIDTAPPGVSKRFGAIPDTKEPRSTGRAA